MRRLALVPTLIAALLLPSGAHALGLGEIEVQSALNQRLDAEIPLRGVPSRQGDNIEVSLASEEAFENVGLDRPFALTRLRFTVKQRDGGEHYVHITSRESIVEPFLSFLVEIDWSGGSLLREYTVLLDPPVFTSEDDSGRSGGSTDTARTTEAGDGAGVTGEIERDAGSTEDRSEETQSASGTGQTGSGDGDDQPVFLEVEEREKRAERARAEADAERAEGSGNGGSASRSAGVPEQYGPVGEGETLWSIASRLKSGDMTVQQMMIALLRYNPDAFAGENINRLKQGYVLRVPDSDRVLQVSAQRALATVREQNSVWRELQEGSRTQTSVAASEQGSSDAGAAGASGSGPDDAELSIVGADEGGASSDEAASATGSSSADESRKLQLAREQLESTRLEKEELESRVNQLEQTVAKMEKLLELRDERLSALQAELREIEGRQAEEEDSGLAADEEAVGEDEGATDGESVADSGEADADDEETVAAVDGGAVEDGESATAGTSGGAGAEDGEAAGDDTASTDTADAGGEDAESTEATASAGEQADAEYIPEDKRATEADRGVQTTRTQEPEKTWLDKVNGVVAAVTGILAGVGGGLLGGPAGLGLAAAVVLLGGGLILMRRRREAAETDAADDFDPVEPDTDIAPFDADSSGRFEAQAPDSDPDEQNTRTASAEDAQSALMAEEFDVASLDEDEPADRTASGALDEPASGIDDEDAEKDDTVAEADVYLAYGLHQQAEDLLRVALREQSGNAMYREKLLETLYASGKTEEFIEEAGTFRDRVDGPESRLWQRVLAMGRDIAPNHELFADGDTQYTAADVQPARPAETDLELDDAGGDIDFGLDDEPENASGGGSGAAAERNEDEFSSTMMLDSSDFGAIEGDGGLVGPDDDRPGDGEVGTTAPIAPDQADEDDDLEFDIGDLDSLTADEGAPAAAASGPDHASDEPGEIDFDLDDDAATQTADSTGTGGQTDDGALDFDLDFDEPGTPAKGEAGTNEADAPGADAPTGAESSDGGLDFDFDLEETSTESTPTTTSADETGVAGPADSADDDALEIGDLEIGDLDSLEMESAGETDTGEAEASSAPETTEAGGNSAADVDAFDLSDLETELDDGAEKPTADESTGVFDSGDRAVAADDADDAFDLSDLDAAGGAETDDGAFNLDDLGAAEPQAPESPESGSSVAPQADESAAGAGGTAAPSGAESAPDEDEEFDTMLDLARAYIDMGDPESATNALEEVASSGNEQQRSEAQSLLDSVR